VFAGGSQHGGKVHTALLGGELARIYPMRRVRGIAVLLLVFALMGLAMAVAADEIAAGGPRSSTEIRVVGVLCFALTGTLGARALPLRGRTSLVALTPQGLHFRSALTLFVPWRAIGDAWDDVSYGGEVLAISLRSREGVRVGPLARVGMALNRRQHGWDLTINTRFFDPQLQHDVLEHLNQSGARNVGTQEER
jgi:hypothetical protein